MRFENSQIKTEFFKVLTLRGNFTKRPQCKKLYLNTIS